MPDVYLVEISEQPIELYKLLKIADLVSGGGEAKVMISEGYVLLNNEVEFQKRKKVYDGDYIQFGDSIIEVQFVEAPIVDEQSIEVEVKPTPKQQQKQKEASKKSKTKNKKQSPNGNASSKNNSGKRRAISF